MRFSGRASPALEENALAAHERRLRAQGRALFDLTLTDPRRCGLAREEAAVLAALGRPEVLEPVTESRGLLRARQALATRGHQPERCVLTASTSEAYGLLLKLLCDPGDDVLAPQPGYPLLTELATFEGVGLRRYPLAFDGQWVLHPELLLEASTERTRAVVVVNPGHPTGAFLREAELDALGTLCAERGWALICDEVFRDWALSAADDRVSTVSGRSLPCLTFALGGLSKTCALPQLKLAWIEALGPSAAVDEALERLEVLNDAYLSAAAPVQHALPTLLALGPSLRAPVRERVRRNRELLTSALRSQRAWSLLPSEAGWSAVIRVPELPNEERRCLQLLDRGLKVQPGYFYDFPRGSYLVLSLLAPASSFGPGLARLVALP